MQIRAENKSSGWSPIDFLAKVHGDNLLQMTRRDIENAVPYKNDVSPISDAIKYIQKISRELEVELSDFSDLRFLDIACGGVGSDGHYPWLAAILSQLANVQGLDLATQPKELKGYYQHIECNLAHLGENGLLEVPGITPGYDVITFFNTINSRAPHSPTMKAEMRNAGKTVNEMEFMIKQSAKRLLQPHGILYMDSSRGVEQVLRVSDLSIS